MQPRCRYWWAFRRRNRRSITTDATTVVGPGRARSQPPAHVLRALAATARPIDRGSRTSRKQECPLSADLPSTNGRISSRGRVRLRRVRRNPRRRSGGPPRTTLTNTLKVQAPPRSGATSIVTVSWPGRSLRITAPPACAVNVAVCAGTPNRLPSGNSTVLCGENPTRIPVASGSDRGVSQTAVASAVARGGRAPRRLTTTVSAPAPGRVAAAGDGSRPGATRSAGLGARAPPAAADSGPRMRRGTRRSRDSARRS
jgi:hypothetical protein